MAKVGADQVGAPATPDVNTCPAVPATVYACAVPVPYPTPPAVGVAVLLVPPEPIANVADKPAAVVAVPALPDILVDQVGAPATPEINTCPDVPATVYACAVPVPYPTPPAVGVAVLLVPPEAIAKVADKPAAVPVVL